MTTGQQMDFLDDLPADSPTQPAQPSSEHLNHGMQEPRLHPVSGVPGLYYFPEFLDSAAQSKAVAQIDASSECWLKDLERRVQHYGWRYDYRARTITSDMGLGPLPDWVAEIAKRLCDETKLFNRTPDQAIVNEYVPGQGIALHADKNCFGPAVATISLGDDWEMKLRPVRGKSSEDKRILLVRGSALIMVDEARDRWMHGIDKRMIEAPGRRKRRRRLSLTFRTVDLQNPQPSKRIRQNRAPTI